MYNRKNNSLQFSESAFVYFPNSFNDFDFEKLELEISKLTGFDILFAYSFNNQNFSEFRSKITQKFDYPIYLCMWVQKQIQNDLEKPISILEHNDATKFWGSPYKMQNVDSTEEICVIDNIKYDSEEICITTLLLRQQFEIINEFPRWNFYDLQQTNIQRWLKNCNAIAEMYGHTCIYFKTEPVEYEQKNEQTGIHGTHFTLNNNVIRNVVDVKKIHIMFPSNELPQDRVVFSEWDIGMQDETIIHVVRQKFEQAFGYKAVPNEKDFIYIPLINKLFRVSTMQVKNGFMGVVGWYEVFLSKYEEDESVRNDSVIINKELSNSIDNVFGFNPEEFGFEPYEEEFPLTEELKADLDEIKSDSIEVFDDMSKRIDEEKEATYNLTNRLRDTTFYVSLKETDALREFYDNRLTIASVNPKDSLFMITMYDCTLIEKKTIALNYNLKSYTLVNQHSLTVKKKCLFCFDFVLLNRHTGSILSLNNEQTMNLVLSIEKKKLVLFDVKTQVTMYFDFEIKQKELYQFAIEYVIDNVPIYSVKVFKLSSNHNDKSTQKILLNQNIYNIKDLSLLEIKDANYYNRTLNGISLFGGAFLIGNLKLQIDNNIILEDKCLPLINKQL